MHGIQGVDPCNGNVIPLFLQGMSQLARLVGAFVPLQNPHIQFVPQVFSRGQIWTERVYVLLARNCWQTWETWSRALSCWKIRLRACSHGTATGRKISSLYMFIILSQAIKYLLHILYTRFQFRPSIFQLEKKDPTLRKFPNDVKKSKCSYTLNLCDICPGI